MDDLRERQWVFLREICEERQSRKDAQTGRTFFQPAYFSSMQAMIEGAFRFVEFFEKIHERGEVYGGVSPDYFQFDLKGGAFRFAEGVPLCREGEICPENDGALFTEFLAPELMEAEAYTLETDRYFMAVFLFEYFFHTGSPFEGKKMVNRCFLSPEEKEMFRAREGVFCMDPGGENAPVRGIQDRLIRYWQEYPDFLQKMFQKAFLDGGRLRELRPTEVDWKQLLVRLAMDYKTCDCGFHGFSKRLLPKENGTCACPKCGKVYYPLTNGMDRILLAQDEKLYECQTGQNPFDKDTVTGLVAENQQHRGLYGIKNVSEGVWKGFYPDGKTREISQGQGIPVWSGMTIRFERGEEWSLRLVHIPAEGGKEEENEQTE